MALNTLHNVTLSEAQISIILYTLEDYMSSDRKSNDPDLESDVNSIFEELEGTIDKHYDKIEAARKKQPKAEWQPLKCNPIEYRIIMKLKNILYRNYNSLTNDEKEFYSENKEKYNLGICDKYNTIEIRLIYIEYDFEFLSERGLKECQEKCYTALSEEAFEELTQ